MPDLMITEEKLLNFTVSALQKAGLSTGDAKIAAGNLVKADLWGLSSHGVSRLPRYIMRLLNGRIRVNPEIRIDRPCLSVLSVDGDNGLGSVVMHKALREAISVAKTQGIAVIGVKNSNHFGAAGYYAELAAYENLISIGMTNAQAVMPPWGGKEPFFGTNPIAFGLPREGKPPIIADMATSVTARGKIIIAAQKGRAIPEGWAVDENGVPTTDAKKALMGMLLPMAGPKGYSLALAVDFLSGVLTGADFGCEVSAYKNGVLTANIGHFFILLKTDLFISGYAERMETFCCGIKETKPADGIKEVFLPGEREHLTELRCREAGIPIAIEIIEDLKQLGNQLHIPFPEI